MVGQGPENARGETMHDSGRGNASGGASDDGGGQVPVSRQLQALKEAVSRWEDMFHKAVVGIYRSHISGRFLMVNQTLARILGYDSSEELLSAAPYIAQLYVDPAERSHIITRLKQYGAVDAAEVRFKHRRGNLLWIRISARFIGETIFEGFVQDITRQKLAEIASQRNEQRFRMLIDQAGDSFFVHDYAGQILDVNHHACETLGFGREELLGKNILSLSANVRREEFWFPLEPGQYVTFESAQRRKDGTIFPVEVRLGRLDIGDEKLLLSLVRGITERKKTEDRLKRSLEEIRQLKNRFEEENIYLREEIELRYRHEEIVGNSRVIKQTLRNAEIVAREDTCVLIQGETGTGKELLARAIHNMSPRKGRPMIKVNCAALPPNLIESELFGHEKGAFTGAVTRQIGRFEAANGSTLFLDEIGDLPLELQAKLLTVLQDGAFERLGSTRTIRVDVRLIAATNHDLLRLVGAHRFRRDLFYRLNVFPITTPPLRERREDIPLLIWAFVEEFSRTMGKHITTISRKEMQRLQNNEWPGNVRELRNFVERAMILSTGETLAVGDLMSDRPPTPRASRMAEMERGHILEILESTGWRVSGPVGAARLLGLKESTLRSRMKRLGIMRPRTVAKKMRK